MNTLDRNTAGVDLRAAWLTAERAEDVAWGDELAARLATYPTDAARSEALATAQRALAAACENRRQAERTYKAARSS